VQAVSYVNHSAIRRSDDSCHSSDCGRGTAWKESMCSGEHIDNCYFPTNSVASLLYTMEDGSTAEVGLVGNEGVLGVALFLGGESSCSRTLVAVAGDAFRLSATFLKEEFAHPGPLQHSLLRYTQAFITQVSQTAVCNRLHSVEQRLRRWLLLCDDRENRSELCMTQELIANMLEGRRETITLAAGRLQHAGLIHYCRAVVSQRFASCLP